MSGPLRVGSLFSGIGGIDLGLERTGGFRTAWFAEVDPYASRVLARHWPDVPNLGDVHTIGGDAPRVDVLAGGFPCQPVSDAGRRKAQADERWLWPEFERLVGALRPRIVVVENVPGLASRGLADVVGGLATLGYDAEWDVVSAASVGAPHRRERLFVVAYPARLGREERGLPGVWEDGGLPDPAGCCGCSLGTAGEDHQGGARSLAGANGVGCDRRPRIFGAPGWREPADGGWWSVEPDVGRVAHGVPCRVDRLRALGNGVVPQVAEFVGDLILDAVHDGCL